MEQKLPTTNAIPQREQEQEKEQDNQTEHEASNALPLIAILFLTFCFAQTAQRVRHQPLELSFVVSAYVVLGLLFWCLRQLEKLSAEQCSPAEKRERGERLRLAVWLLATALSCAFAWRVSEIMPFFLAVIIWVMTALVAMVGFFGLFVYKQEEYRRLDNAEEDIEKGFQGVKA